MLTAEHLSLHPIAIEQDDDTVYDPMLKAILVSESGTLVVENEFGDEITINI